MLENIPQTQKERLDALELLRELLRNEQRIKVKGLDLTPLTSQLYSAKEKFVIPRSKKKEESYNLMQTNKFRLFFTLERIDFLAEESLEIISLISVLDCSLGSLNQMIFDYNDYLIKNTKNGILLISQDSTTIDSFNKNLFEQLDEALYLSEKLQSVLIEYGQKKFKKNFKIKSVDLQEKYKGLKPKVMSDWEGIDFFPLHKRWFNWIK